jgi:hypothetical protein
MKVQRDEWTPVTVTFETVEECQIMHTLLALVLDGTDERVMSDFLGLFSHLGRGWTESKYKMTGSINIED